MVYGNSGNDGIKGAVKGDLTHVALMQLKASARLGQLGAGTI